jgi:Ca2+-binding EF-hand superfamily protein
MNATHDQKKKTPEHTSASSVQTADESNESQLFFVEELSDELIRRFQSQQVTPYFKSVFADLVLRSQPAKDPRFNNLCDKVTLVEYMNLPGILSDRFCALMGSNPKQGEGRLNSEKFLHVMSQVYSSTVEEKMRMCFEMYDFD